ncbi:MAG: hypothetical protein ABSF84_01770 [Acidimicrobiales bacterium]|jgi:photosystem II stability/assembly factor-like uncharacterized protein
MDPRRCRGALVGAAVAVLAVIAAACGSGPTASSRSIPPTTAASTTTKPSSSTTSPATTPTTVPVVGPPGGPIPAGFRATSFTAASLDAWWLLGTAPCLTGSGTCGAIVRTTDGGSIFAGIPSPPVGVNAVSQLRFANPLDGYAFGPGLWQTADGGATWADVAVPGQVTELEAADGEAYALVTGAGTANSTSNELLTAPVGSQQWRQVPTPAPLGFGAQFALSGPNLYVLGGDGDMVLLYSSDRGAQFSQRVDPCTAGLGGSVTAAADGTPTLWAACPTGMMAEAMVSTDGGVTWRVATATRPFPNSLELAAASSSVALASPVPETLTGALFRTTDGGGTYAVVLSGSSPSTVSWMGFSDPSRAYALLAGGLFESTDGGATWHSVAFTS